MNGPGLFNELHSCLSPGSCSITLAVDHINSLMQSNNSSEHVQSAFSSTQTYEMSIANLWECASVCGCVFQAGLWCNAKHTYLDVSFSTQILIEGYVKFIHCSSLSSLIAKWVY